MISDVLFLTVNDWFLFILRQQLLFITPHTTVFLYFLIDNDCFLISSKKQSAFHSPPKQPLFVQLSPEKGCFLLIQRQCLLLYVFSQKLCFISPQTTAAFSLSRQQSSLISVLYFSPYSNFFLFLTRRAIYYFPQTKIFFQFFSRQRLFLFLHRQQLILVYL